VSGGLTALRPTLVDLVIRELPDVDVHVIARDGRRATVVAMDRPDPDALIREAAHVRNNHDGHLRIYLGYARGCGATTAMLDEARRRAARGGDVVVAALTATAPNLAGLQVLGGPGGIGERGVLDVEALLARNPGVAAVDDLAGPTAAGGTTADAMPRLRAAGISVIATAELPTLQSVSSIMGTLLEHRPGSGSVTDRSLDDAEELELVDIMPAELIERVRRGEVMPLAEAARALQADFRPDTLAVLRATAFRYVAHHTDRSLVRYMSSARITQPWEARPRVVVCIPPQRGQERLMQRAATLARSRDEDLTALSVRRDRHPDEVQQLLGGYATLTHQLGGEFVTVYGSDVAAAIAKYAEDRCITEILMMRSPRSGHRSRTTNRLIRMLSDVNVHVLAQMS